MDPFSDPRYSRREWQYSLIYDREHQLKNPSYLYLTPLLMIDGRTPMVGSDSGAPAKAREAIRRAIADRAEVTLELVQKPDAKDPRRQTLDVAVAAAAPGMAGREVLVEVVTVEDGLTTKVGSGELAGETYVGRNVARAFTARTVRLPRRGSGSASVSVALEEGWEPAKCRLVALVQDETNGRVYQARMVPWNAEPDREAAGR